MQCFIVLTSILFQISGAFPGNLEENARRYYKIGLYDSSRLTYQQVLNSNLKFDKEKQAEIELEYGTVLIDLGEYEESSILLYSILDRFESGQNTNLIARTLIQIGRIQRRQNEKEKALGTADRVLSLLAQSKSAPDSAGAYRLMGLVYMDMLSGVQVVGPKERKIIDQCKSYYDEALRISRKYNDTLAMLTNMHYVASMHHSLKRNEKARAMWTEVIELSDQIGALRAKCYAIRGMGGNYAFNNQCEIALKYFSEARVLARQIGDAKIFAHVTDNLATCHGNTGDYKSAYEYEQLYTKLKDSLIHNSYKQTIAQLETEYETSRKEQQITLLEQESQIQFAEIRSKNTIIFSTVIGFLGLTLFGFILYRKKQESTRLKFEKQLLELEQKALHLQMNPHFIFNSLNAIQGYISEKNHNSAREYLSKFARLMRIILESSRESAVALETEIDLLTNYLELAALRFENKFDYSISSHEVDETSTGIPPMMIQPFVENAVIHGIVPSKSKGQININFEKDGTNVKCTVTDNGVGRTSMDHSEQSNGHKSLAMDITQQRLQALYSSTEPKHSFNITDLTPGTSVTINLPILDLW